MGLWPSCVKTAPRKAAVWLFMITEQVIYICIFSSLFDTPLDFFGRLLLKLPYTAWYATHTGSPSGHHQWRLKSDEEKERVKREEKKREFFTQLTRKGTTFPQRRPCFDHSVLIWWTIAQRLQLLGPPSYPFSHRFQSNSGTKLSDNCLTGTQHISVFYKISPQWACRQCLKMSTLVGFILPNFSS